MHTTVYRYILSFYSCINIILLLFILMTQTVRQIRNFDVHCCCSFFFIRRLQLMSFVQHELYRV